MLLNSSSLTDLSDHPRLCYACELIVTEIVNYSISSLIDSLYFFKKSKIK